MAKLTKNIIALSKSYTEQFTEYYRLLGLPCYLADGTLWLEGNRMIFPVGPVSRSYSLPRSTARELLTQSRSALLVKYTDGFHADLASSAWYAVICRSFVDLSEYNSKKRSQIRRALRDCVAQQVDARYIADHGYDIYAAAAVRYAGGRKSAPKSKERFRQIILQAEEFQDVIDFWAVLHGDQLAGFAQVHRFGSTEANYSSMTFDPAFFRSYASYALIYRMNEHYLRENRVEYVNDGFRSLLHRTELQSFLISKFGFERAFTHLYVYYKPLVALIMTSPTSLAA